jgi:hypothetical protein
VNTIGIVDVAAFATKTDGRPLATIMAAGRWTSSAASTGRRAYSPSHVRDLLLRAKHLFVEAMVAKELWARSNPAPTTAPLAALLSHVTGRFKQSGRAVRMITTSSACRQVPVFLKIFLREVRAVS